MPDGHDKRDDPEYVERISDALRLLVGMIRSGSVHLVGEPWADTLTEAAQQLDHYAMLLEALDPLD